MPTFSLNTIQEIWVLAPGAEPFHPQDRVGRPDMDYFRIPECGLHGLAACHLEEGDAIGHLPNTQLAFAVRRIGYERAVIVGRAYLYTAARLHEAILEPWLDGEFYHNTARHSEQQVLSDWATLLELDWLADSTGDRSADAKQLKSSARTLGILKENWTSNIVIAGSSESSKNCYIPQVWVRKADELVVIIFAFKLAEIMIRFQDQRRHEVS